MTNAERPNNEETQNLKQRKLASFALRHSFVIRGSSFVIHYKCGLYSLEKGLDHAIGQQRGTSMESSMTDPAETLTLQAYRDNSALPEKGDGPASAKGPSPF